MVLPADVTLPPDLLDMLPAELVRGDRAFRVGDKVMQLKNDYDKNVFNGDIGLIDMITSDDGPRMRVDFGALTSPLVPRFVMGGLALTVIGLQTFFAAFLLGTFAIPHADRS